MESALSRETLSQALKLGFDLAAVLPIGPPGRFAAFTSWLAQGFHGEMSYLAERPGQRGDPSVLAPGARSMILLVANHNPGAMPSALTGLRHGRIARYAWGADYHDPIKARLYELDAFLRARTGRQTPGKACVDTAPLLERDHVAQAGLGFVGRNTCLISPGLGSWTFLAALLVPEDLSPGSLLARGSGGCGVGATDADRFGSAARQGTCGRCTRCLDACPTQAFVAPYVLDARRCISYLTIELRGPIPRELRHLMGDWVFGCDVCQEVCPYNRSVPAHGLDALVPSPARAAIPISDLLAFDEAHFRETFRLSAIMRAKRRGLVRNACVAAGNAGDDEAVPSLVPLLEDAEPLVRGHAAWALGRIGGSQAAEALHVAFAREGDSYVQDEIASARAGL